MQQDKRWLSFGFRLIKPSSCMTCKHCYDEQVAGDGMIYAMEIFNTIRCQLHDTVQLKSGLSDWYVCDDYEKG